ncbi:MAG: hypothetical protein IT373_16305 [Polyangiaceae bacterium]|nr:hypothetical protein [Polyangiaceae bacterium]
MPRSRKPLPALPFLLGLGALPACGSGGKDAPASDAGVVAPRTTTTTTTTSVRVGPVPTGARGGAVMPAPPRPKASATSRSASAPAAARAAGDAPEPASSAFVLVHDHPPDQPCTPLSDEDLQKAERDLGSP